MPYVLYYKHVWTIDCLLFHDRSFEREQKSTCDLFPVLMDKVPVGTPGPVVPCSPLQSNITLLFPPKLMNTNIPPTKHPPSADTAPNALKQQPFMPLLCLSCLPTARWWTCLLCGPTTPPRVRPDQCLPGGFRGQTTHKPQCSLRSGVTIIEGCTLIDPN